MEEERLGGAGALPWPPEGPLHVPPMAGEILWESQVRGFVEMLACVCVCLCRVHVWGWGAVRRRRARLTAKKQPLPPSSRFAAQTPPFCSPLSLQGEVRARPPCRRVGPITEGMVEGGLEAEQAPTPSMLKGVHGGLLWGPRF